MDKTKSLITKNHASFTCKINYDLQKCNSLASKGIFLVEVENGVVWGYDSDKYMYDENNLIVRKKLDD